MAQQIHRCGIPRRRSWRLGAVAATLAFGACVDVPAFESSQPDDTTVDLTSPETADEVVVSPDADGDVGAETDDPIDVADVAAEEVAEIDAADAEDGEVGCGPEGAETIAYYPDCDGDLHGDRGASPIYACGVPASAPDACPFGAWSLVADDCRDDDAAVHPDAEELCNGVDDDCDDATDPGCDCQSGSTRGCGVEEALDGVGICRRGTQECQDGVWGTCEGATPVGVEACNDLDDDCDGDTDEGDNGCGGVCSLAAEPGSACDGEDADLCPDDNILCVGPNEVACGVGEDNAELCNDVDDDCDGTADEGENGCGGVCPLAALGASCDGPDADACEDDTWICDGANAVVCSEGDDQVEVCNDFDDDCDGTADEGENGCGGVCPLPDLGEPCDGDDEDTCEDDSYVCDGRNATVCSDGANAAEVCNGIDDDCDGTTDEGDNPCGGVCTLSDYGDACSGDSDECEDDSMICDGMNATRCSSNGTKVEICNEEDDDCDGTIDEGNNPCGGVCTLSDYGEACSGDSDECEDDSMICDGKNDTRCSSNGTKVEICNEEDDDCDGTTDEGNNPCGGVCTLSDYGDACSGDGDECEDDSKICDGKNATRCSSNGTKIDVCDGEDNDCDGTIDDGDNGCGGSCALDHTLGTACDGDDSDYCSDDIWLCLGRNDTVCSSGADNSDSSCNGIDDDCNSNTDPDTCACASVVFYDDDHNLGCGVTGTIGSGNYGGESPTNGACRSAVGGADLSAQITVTPTASCHSGSITLRVYDLAACSTSGQFETITIACSAGTTHVNLNCWNMADKVASYRLSCPF